MTLKTAIFLAHVTRNLKLGCATFDSNGPQESQFEENHCGLFFNFVSKNVLLAESNSFLGEVVLIWQFCDMTISLS